MHSVSMSVPTRPVQFSGPFRPKKTEKEPKPGVSYVYQTQAEAVQNQHEKYKKSRFWQIFGGVALALTSLNLLGNVTEASIGQNNQHAFGIEQTSNAVDIGVEGGLAGLILLGIRGNRREKKQAREALNKLGYVVVGNKLVKTDDKVDFGTK